MTPRCATTVGSVGRMLHILGSTHPRTLFVVSELAYLHLSEEPDSALDLLSKGWRTAHHALNLVTQMYW